MLLVITQKSLSGSTIKPRSHHINYPVRSSRRRTRKPRNQSTYHPSTGITCLLVFSASDTHTLTCTALGRERERERTFVSAPTSRTRARTHPHTRTHGKRNAEIAVHHQILPVQEHDDSRDDDPLPSGADTSSRHPLPFASGEFPPRGSRITRVDSAHFAGQRVISTRGPAPTVSISLSPTCFYRVRLVRAFTRVRAKEKTEESRRRARESERNRERERERERGERVTDDRDD